MLLVSGEHAEVNKVATDLIISFGFVSVDVGRLIIGGRLQQAGGALAGHDLLLND
ncbi:hypothetical protein [Paraburkholderia strydomiana]|uniref:hypothetical protein n=1 Tax=Paraburkholderia strydomiana TaxID=1245417 RepID=UPI001BE8817F|nr:hypothetical protein [Paraburkholderia strydomiana]MBT2792809.1 hypothetical protein [Paraburkholderia strydomiana]